MTKEKKFMMFGVILLLISLVGSLGTYAWFTWKSTNNTSITMSIGKLADVIFTSGNDISTSTLAPVYNYTDGEKTTFSINNKDTSGTTIDYAVKLNITSIASELKSADLKYVLLKNDTIVKEGDFSTISTGSTVIYSDSISSSGVTNFVFYLYIDGNEENDLNMMNKLLAGTLTVEATEKESFATYITNLYNNATKTTVTNNSINYEYDTTHSLMKDVGDNIRYYGTEPNNYIYFNCSDYSNQSSSTCETWRIIGVFDGKLKLIRNEKTLIISYDDNDEDTYLQTISNYNDAINESMLKHNFDSNEKTMFLGFGVLDKTGENDYSKSSLQKILNNYYYNGLKYIGDTTLDFTSIGIKNDATRNLLAEVTYNLGANSDSLIYPNQIYEYERGMTVYSGNETTWIGKLAIPYLSDYGYAVDFRKCTKQLRNYDDTTCVSNSWMVIIENGWILNHDFSDSTTVWLIASNGAVGCESANFENLIYPVLYLNSELNIKGGTGSSSDPYQLKVS